MKIDPNLMAVLSQFHDDPQSAVWNCHGTWVAYHKDLEVIAAKAGIEFDMPIVLEADSQNKCAALCVTGKLKDRTEWSIGEAAPANNKNQYPFAMAEKRAKDRVILKLIGLHGLVYSEEEADAFKPPEKPTGDDIVFKTVQDHIRKSTTLDELRNRWEYMWEQMSGACSKYQIEELTRLKDIRKA
jgi:hypothetical protein